MTRNKSFLLGLAVLFIFETGIADNKPKISQRFDCTAVYDSVNKQMIVFGGYILGEWAENVYLSDIWTFDIEKKEWKEIKSENFPPERACHTAIYDSANKQMIVFAGVNSRGSYSDVWIFDIEKKKWEKILKKEKPTERTKSSAIYDSINNQMIIFGGSGQGAWLSDTWIFDIEKKEWKEIKTKEAPLPRAEHTAVYDPINKQMIIFGGKDKGVLCDTWIFDIEKKEWKEIEAEEFPVGRQMHTAIYDSANKQMIIFGGHGPGTYLSDTWAFDVGKKCWKEIETENAPKREGHSTIYDSANKQMIVFDGFHNDVWMLNIEKKEWEDVELKGGK